MADFPTRPEEVDTAWLEERLSEAGVLGDARIIDFGWQSIGTGQVGDTARFELQYRGSTGTAPTSVAVKFPSGDPTSRQTASSLSLYAREVMFYREVAALTPMRVPVAYASLLDENGCDFVLLFEDLGPCQAGNQLDGCTLTRARDAVLQAAALHAATRDHPVLDAVWLQPNQDVSESVRALYPQAQAIFRDRYADALAPDLMAVCQGLADNLPLWLDLHHSSRSFLHGDFRLDNMLFDIKGGQEPIAVLDWQTAAVGCGLTDIGYFLGCGIGSALRRQHERTLLDVYCSEMTRLGVPATVDDIWDDYRIGALHGIATAVFSAAFVVRTERGDANFLSMARGACELALEHDSLGALKRRMEPV